MKTVLRRHSDANLTLVESFLSAGRGRECIISQLYRRTTPLAVEVAQPFLHTGAKRATEQYISVSTSLI